MKLSLQSPSFYNDDQDVQHRIELISKLPYASNIHDDWLNDHFIKEDHNSRIRNSKYTSEEEWSETSELVQCTYANSFGFKVGRN